MVMGVMIHCNGNSVYIFRFWELRGLSPNCHIHVSVSDLYIPRISPHISSSRKGRPIVGIYNSLTDTCMWKLGLRPGIPFLGIYVSNFRHFVYAVQIHYRGKQRSCRCSPSPLMQFRGVAASDVVGCGPRVVPSLSISDRKQFVFIYGKCSPLLIILICAPQGVKGPSLDHCFSNFASMICPQVPLFCAPSFFADDSKLFASGLDINVISSFVNEEFQQVVHFFMALHPSKKNFLLYTNFSSR